MKKWEPGCLCSPEKQKKITIRCLVLRRAVVGALPPLSLIHICVVVVEVQQNSNVTYRVYDYGRVGADGKPRALHVEKALDVTQMCIRDRAMIPSFGCILQFISPFVFERMHHRKPVSYTHLDVYKRQGLWPVTPRAASSLSPRPTISISTSSTKLKS